MMRMYEYRTLLGTSPNATSDELLQAYSFKKTELEELLRDARLSFDMKNEIFIQLNQLRRAYQILLLYTSHGSFEMPENDNDDETNNNEDLPDAFNKPQDGTNADEDGVILHSSPESLQNATTPEEVKEIKHDNTNDKEDKKPKAEAHSETTEEDAPCCGLFRFCC